MPARTHYHCGRSAAVIGQFSSRLPPTFSSSGVNWSLLKNSLRLDAACKLWSARAQSARDLCIERTWPLTPHDAGRWPRVARGKTAYRINQHSALTTAVPGVFRRRRCILTAAFVVLMDHGSVHSSSASFPHFSDTLASLNSQGIHEFSQADLEP